MHAYKRTLLSHTHTHARVSSNWALSLACSSVCVCVCVSVCVCLRVCTLFLSVFIAYVATPAYWGLLAFCYSTLYCLTCSCVLFFQFLFVFVRLFVCARVCGSQRTDNKSISCVNIKLPATDNAHCARQKVRENKEREKERETGVLLTEKRSAKPKTKLNTATGYRLHFRCPSLSEKRAVNKNA